MNACEAECFYEAQTRQKVEHLSGVEHQINDPTLLPLRGRHARLLVAALG